MTRPHLPVAPGVVRAVLGYVSANNVMFNTYYVYNPGGWDGGSLGACASAIYNWELSTACKHRGFGVGLISITLTDLTSPTSPFYSFPIGAPVNGTLDSPLVPENVTFSFTALTGERGTGRQGRTFWIGLTLDQVAGDRLDADAADQITNDLRALHDVMHGVGGSNLVTLHRHRDGVVLNPAEHTDITGWGYKDLTVDVQTNRLPGRRRYRPRRP